MNHHPASIAIISLFSSSFISVISDENASTFGYLQRQDLSRPNNCNTISEDDWAFYIWLATKTPFATFSFCDLLSMTSLRFFFFSFLLIYFLFCGPSIRGPRWYLDLGGLTNDKYPLCAVLIEMDSFELNIYIINLGDVKFDVNWTLMVDP